MEELDNQTGHDDAGEEGALRISLQDTSIHTVGSSSPSSSPPTSPRFTSTPSPPIVTIEEVATLHPPPPQNRGEMAEAKLAEGPTPADVSGLIYLIKQRGSETYLDDGKTKVAVYKIGLTRDFPQRKASLERNNKAKYDLPDSDANPDTGPWGTLYTHLTESLIKIRLSGYRYLGEDDPDWKTNTKDGTSEFFKGPEAHFKLVIKESIHQVKQSYTNRFIDDLRHSLNLLKTGSN